MKAHAWELRKGGRSWVSYCEGKIQCRCNRGTTNLHCSPTSANFWYVPSSFYSALPMVMCFELSRALSEPKGIKWDSYSLLVDMGEKTPIWDKDEVLLGLYISVALGIRYGFCINLILSFSGKGHLQDGMMWGLETQSVYIVKDQSWEVVITKVTQIDFTPSYCGSMHTGLGRVNSTQT